MENLIYDSISEDIIALAESIVLTDGVKNLNVRRIITELNVTNRVFYNRFSNIDAVLEIIAERAAKRMHESFSSDKDLATDFFGYVTDIVVKVLLNTYECKNRFSQYMFEFDSLNSSNFNWWNERIKKLIDYAKATNQLKNVDSDKLSYTIWCFLRGFNADAVNRNLSKENAVENLKFGINCLFDGVRKI